MRINASADTEPKNEYHDENCGSVTLSQLQHQRLTFPVEEALECNKFGGSQPGKIVNDPVHGHMYFSGIVVDAIDTPQVQRLRELKQLGTAYYVFPGAAHNRFEHSLGTCHLATNVFEALRRSSGKEVKSGLKHSDRLSTQLAGLCHDLGHGPFSHVFDNEFLPRRYPDWHKTSSPWNHEAMSADMFEWMVDENNLDVGEEVVRRVRKLITSDDSGAPAGKKFLWDIVANKRNSVDVDKFDYLMRDATCAGVRGSVDISRLISFMRVIDDKICFKASEAFIRRFIPTRRQNQSSTCEPIFATYYDVLLFLASCHLYMFMCCTLL
jgi:deoxynucleoside triphosphate triphosphohydrolase SAMHD1